MAIQKCYICGGTVEPSSDPSVGTCTQCSCAVTLPVTTDGKRAAIHNSAIHFRRTGDFDHALSIYQHLLEEEPTDAEALWGAVLCKYGVNYRKTSSGWTPEAERPAEAPVMEDPDFQSSMTHSTEAAQAIRLQEAARITPVNQEPADPAQLLQDGFRLLDQQQWDSADAAFRKLLACNPDNGMAALGRLLAEQKCRKPVDLKECTAPFDDSETYRTALRCADPAMAETLERCAEFVRKHTKREETRAIYQKAVARMKAAKTEEEFKRTAAAFSYIPDYHDSAALAEECRQKAAALRKDGIYRAAVMAMNEGSFAEAADALAMIPGWRNVDELLEVCRSEAKPKSTPKPQPAPKRSRRWLIVTAVVLVLLIALGIGGYFLMTEYIIPQQAYDAADVLLQLGQREEAIAAFEALGPYRDSADRAEGIRSDWYDEAEALLAVGDDRRAAFSFGGLKDYRDTRERSFALWDTFAHREVLSAGGQYSLGIRTDGMVLAAGRNEDKQLYVGDWMNIMDISAGWSHSVGLRTDGTVARAGYNYDGRSAVEDWRDIVAVSTGEWHTVGLQSTGTVIAVGYNEDGRCAVSDWDEIIAVSAGRNHTVGLRLDGTVVAVGDNTYGQCDVSDWTKVIAVSAGGAHTVGIRADGTLLVAGSNDEGQLNIGGWENIVSIRAGYYHTVGLKADGTVVAAGWNEFGQCDVSSWKDVAAIAAGGWHTAAVKKDGTVVSVGQDYYHQCATEEWENIRVPE